jgi:hypothetical protein
MTSAVRLAAKAKGLGRKLLAEMALMALGIPDSPTTCTGQRECWFAEALGRSAPHVAIVEPTQARERDQCYVSAGFGSTGRRFGVSLSRASGCGPDDNS